MAECDIVYIVAMCTIATGNAPERCPVQYIHLHMNCPVGVGDLMDESYRRVVAGATRMVVPGRGLGDSMMMGMGETEVVTRECLAKENGLVLLTRGVSGRYHVSREEWE